jgi:cytochrome c oxidase assembly protein subunit 15
MTSTTVDTIAPPAARDRNRDRRLIRIWLYAIAILVLAMVMVGGATRLTHSGLSITEWKPIHGVIPPLNDAEWQEEFLKYQQIPEYQAVNRGMTLSEFKGIFWWEWSHRLLGRVIGIAFFLPLLFFWATGRIERNLRPQLVAIFILGGLQGAVGWWMVASGLVERTDVSQYRLAAHLMLACLILAYTVWVARGLVPARPHATYPASGTKLFAAVILGLVLLQIYLGAFVAGLDAGLVNNDWPLMAGALIPEGLASQEPFIRNFFENVVTVQFNHRIVAYVLFAAVLVHTIQLARSAPGTRAAWSSYRLMALVLVQVALGIATLVLVVPLEFGLAHQFVAMLVLVGAVAHRRAMSPPIAIVS